MLHAVDVELLQTDSQVHRRSVGGGDDATEGRQGDLGAPLAGPAGAHLDGSRPGLAVDRRGHAHRGQGGHRPQHEHGHHHASPPEQDAPAPLGLAVAHCRHLRRRQLGSDRKKRRTGGVMRPSEPRSVLAPGTGPYRTASGTRTGWASGEHEVEVAELVPAVGPGQGGVVAVLQQREAGDSFEQLQV